MEKLSVIGKVEEARGEFVTVRVLRKTACGEVCGHCGACSRHATATVKNNCGALPGDDVVVTMGSKPALISAFLMYILPLIMLFIGYALHGWALGALFFIVPFAVFKLFEKRLESMFVGHADSIVKNK